MHRIAGPAFLLLLLAGGSLAAQQGASSSSPDSSRVVRLPGIEVTVTRRLEPLRRVPEAVSLVTGPEIQTARPTLGLDESLSLVPGVVVDNRYNYALGTRITIRGFGSRAAFGVRGVRVLVDGIPLTNPDGQAKLNTLDLGAVGEIEVLRGPSSTLYGNAAGGVISLRTETPPSAPFAARARLIAGDYGSGTRLGNLTKWQLEAGGRRGRATYLGSFSHTLADGFRQHSAARLSNFTGTASYALAPGSTLRALLNLADQPRGENPGALPLDSARLHPRLAWPSYVQTGAAERSRQVQGGIGLRQRLGPVGLDVLVYGQNRVVDNPIVPSVIDLNRHTGGIRSTVSADGRLAGRQVALTTGIDLEAQRDARREYTNSGGSRAVMTRNQIDRVTGTGPFAQASLDLGRGLELTAGARYDAVRFATDDRFRADGNDSGSRSLGALSPKIGVLYSTGEALNLYADLATSFQTPTTTELINTPPGPGEPCCAGGFNQALSPEKARSWEAGARGRLADWLRYDLAVYTMSVRDEIVSFRVPQAPDRDFYRNSGRSRHRGLELALEAAPADAIRLALSYTYCRFVFVDDGLPDVNDEGHLLPGVPSHQLAGRIALRAGMLSAEVDGQHVSRFFVDDGNTASDPAYSVVDLRLQARHERTGLGLEPFVGIDNLFDERYNGSVVVNAVGGRFYEPAPGRHVILGLSVPIAGWHR